MTVAELKTLLNSYPDDTVVLRYGEDNGWSRNRVKFTEDDIGLIEVVPRSAGDYDIPDWCKTGPRQQALLIS